MELEEINEYSLTKTIFYLNGKSQNELIDELDYFNIVFARNGIFHVIKNSLYIHFKKTNMIYKNNQLESIEDNTLIQLIKKPNIDVLYEIVDIFTYVKDKINYELLINLYYDTKYGEFIIHIADQNISSAQITYTYNKEYETNTRYIRYLQIHSHHNMKAYFSNTDNNDEYCKCHSYFGVIGDLKNRNSFSQKYRINCHDEFIDLDTSIVFDGVKENIDLDNDVKEHLDLIISLSQKNNNQRIYSKKNMNANNTHELYGLFGVDI